jgi:hypothetical protein
MRLSNRIFPPYAFVPGRFPHPEKEGGYMKGTPQCSPIQNGQESEHLDFLYALDLLNHGYFWESHVWFEAIWNAHGRVGVSADILKALIMIGAAGVKARLGQEAPAEGHLKRAQALLLPIAALDSKQWLGLNLKSLLINLETLFQNRQQVFNSLAQTTGPMGFEFAVELK